MATKTINLTGAEVAVTSLDGANAHIRNDGTDVIYAAKAAGISAGADGVLSIPAGQAATVYGISGTVYMLGTGSAQIISNDYSELPFKTSTASGGSAVDEQARTALGAHEGNAEIHVTASEKASWDDKADPANVLRNNMFASGKDCNDCTDPGWYSFNGCVGHAPGTNSTLNSGTYFILLNVPMSAPGYFVQIATFVHGAANYLGRTYIRHCNNGVWSDWDELIRRSDFDALAARVTALEGGTT